AIADVYEAMTSTRPHRKGIPPHMVLAEILKMSGTLYDPKVAKIFIKHVGVFPVGSMVELTNGHLGLVAVQNESDPLKPTVIIFQMRKKLCTSDAIISRGSWELADLAGEREDYGKIKCGLDHRKFKINPEYYLSFV
ncbi:HD-GYP domain-containing protein, partial [Candidatus Latescibacterota bacterium]